MNLSQEQVQELLNIIDKNQAVLVTQELGPSFLSDADRDLLNQYGVNWEGIYKPEGDTVFTSFHFGMLSEALGQTFSENLTYEQLREYIKMGRYIPPTYKELQTVEVIKRQKFNDLKTLSGKIFKDVNQILINNTLREQKDFLREELMSGIADKRTVTQIAHDIAEKTGDWTRDFERIVAYNSTQAFEEGKAAMIIRNAGEGEDPIVYKNVFEGACDHCVRLYLTKGIGSQPRLFKLSELKGNGNNIGRKTSEWKAVLGGVHPYCRCALMYLPTGYVWSEKEKKFVLGTKTTTISKRKPIRVWVAGEEKFI